MNEENRPEGDELEGADTGEESKDPDTRSDDDIAMGMQGPEVPAGIPVAEEAGAAPAAPPAAPAGPRIFAQHYSILLGATFVLVASLSVWERSPPFKAVIDGPDTISGAFLLALSGYTLLVAILNILHGRLKGMLSAFSTGVIALYLAVKAYFRTQDQEAFIASPEAFKGSMPDASLQERVAAWVGQFGPGIWLAFIGGGFLLLVFFKALFGGKKSAAEPAPAPVTRRRGRR